MAESFVKDPNATLDYQWNWSSWLLDGDTIASATVTAATGLTLASNSNSSTAVTAWLSGGTAGANYPVRCRITTAGGRIDDRTIVLRILEQ